MRLLDRALAADGARGIRLRDLLDSRSVAALDPAGPLFAFRLVDVHGTGPWLDRRAALADDFWPRFADHWPRTATRARAISDGGLSRLALPGDVRECADAAVRVLQGRDAIVVVRGPSGSGRHAVARAIARECARPVLDIDAAPLSFTAVATLLREIRWQQAVLVVEHADACDARLIEALLAGVERARSTAIVTAPVRWRAPVETAIAVDLPAPTPSSRTALWTQLLDEERVPVAGLAVAPIAARYRLSAERIHAIVRALAGRRSPPTEQELAAMCVAATDVAFDGLAHRVDLVHSPEQLIVPATVARELDLVVTWARRATTLFGPHGPGRHVQAMHGLTCLFHGPPGTGKTMAAQVLARRLGIELYRVDLSQLVDKYVGETEKRLDRLFAEADAAGCALLFDEADAVFARRGEVREARDRYANLETSFLLQRLEQHHGLTFLTSNLQRGIDSAFMRRLGLVLEFPLPARAERTAIWTSLLPPPAERASDVSVEFLAERFTLSGGEIRNAVIAAILLADAAGDALSMQHLVYAGWRELQKAGRLVDPRELAPWHTSIPRSAGPQR